jgi:hypothetical protein
LDWNSGQLSGWGLVLFLLDLELIRVDVEWSSHLLLRLVFDWLSSNGVVLSHFVDELASHSIRAVSHGAILFAELGLVKDRDVGLDHHLGLVMGEGALEE